MHDHFYILTEIVYETSRIRLSGDELNFTELFDSKDNRNNVLINYFSSSGGMEIPEGRYSTLYNFNFLLFQI